MTARVLPGVCASGKTRYRNRCAVIAGIDKTRFRFRRHFGRPGPELWHYRCDRCGGWHMTSMSPETYEQKRQTA
ncbi:hypothetical protein GCM10027436_88520 [Actinophytocola sediminis]